MSPRLRYQESFARMFQCVGARAFGMGRHALVVLLKAVGLQPGERVGICGYTCLSVAEAVKVAGGQPVYLDVDEHLCISPGSLQVFPPGSLKVLILQHTFGIPGQLDELLAQAERIGAIVIEDGAHSLGSLWKGRLLGTFGAGAFFSFQWGKSYSTGQGGMLIVNQAGLLGEVDRTIATLATETSLRSDVSLAIQRVAYSGLRLVGGAGRLRGVYKQLVAWGWVRGSFHRQLDFEINGYARLAGPRLAQAGLCRLSRWPAFADVRKKHTSTIIAHLNRQGLLKWPCPSECDPVMIRYPLLVHNKAQIVSAARDSGIDLAGWYDSPVHPLTAAQLSEVGYDSGLCPRAERMISQVVHFPTGESFTEEMLHRGTDILLKG